MLDNYFNLQPPQHNNEDLYNLLFKQLISEAFLDNDSGFDRILDSLNKKNVSLFEVFTIYPQYSAYKDGNDIIVERAESDYNSFISASINFIKEEKYFIKLINCLTKEQIEKNQESMTGFILGLLDNNYKNALSHIIEKNLLTEKEIRLKLILPEKLFHYQHRQVNFHTLEVDFLSKHIHELNLTSKNSHKVIDIYKYVLKNVNSEQYKNITELINHKVDFSVLGDYYRKEIFATLLEFGIVQPNQIIGEKTLLESPKLELKSFLNLSTQAIENLVNLQTNHLEKRLSKLHVDNVVKEKLKKI